MALNYYYPLYRLKTAIKNLEEDLEEFEKEKAENCRHNVKVDIAAARVGLTDIKRCIDNWYLG